MKNKEYFNIRVYGLLINQDKEILVAEEYHFNTYMLKFPGGGLQFGESIPECLQRELKEELNIEILKLEHFHTSEIFVRSAFNENHQVVGIYYHANCPVELINNYRENFKKPEKDGEEKFKWIQLDKLDPLDFTFSNDREVVSKLLKNKFGV